MTRHIDPHDILFVQQTKTARNPSTSVIFVYAAIFTLSTNRPRSHLTSKFPMRITWRCLPTSVFPHYVASRRVVADDATKSHTGVFRLAESHEESTRFYRNDASERYFIYEHDGKYIRVLHMQEEREHERGRK